MTQKNKKIIFGISSIIFLIDFFALFISVVNNQNQNSQDFINMNDFLIIFGMSSLMWIYMLALNLSEKFRIKLFKIASTFIEDKDRMYKNCNLSLLIWTIVYIFIFLAFFCFSVLPSIY